MRSRIHRELPELASVHAGMRMNLRVAVWILVLGASMGCASNRGTAQGDVEDQSKAPTCDLAPASPWISRWFAAWELTSREIMHLPDVPPPNFVFYDSVCVYTTLAVTAPGVTPVALVDALRTLIVPGLRDLRMRTDAIERWLDDGAPTDRAPKGYRP